MMYVSSSGKTKECYQIFQADQKPTNQVKMFPPSYIFFWGKIPSFCFNFLYTPRHFNSIFPLFLTKVIHHVWIYFVLFSIYSNSFPFPSSFPLRASLHLCFSIILYPPISSLIGWSLSRWRSIYPGSSYPSSPGAQIQLLVTHVHVSGPFS